MDSKLFSVSWTHYFWPREVNIFLKRFIFLYFLVVFDNKHCLRYKILHLNKSYMSLLRHYKYTETKRPLKWPYILHKEFCLCCFLTVRPSDDWNPESKILNPVIEIRNPRRGIQKQRLSWIFLHRTILFLVLLISPVVRKLKWLL